MLMVNIESKGNMTEKTPERRSESQIQRERKTELESLIAQELPDMRCRKTSL